MKQSNKNERYRQIPDVPCEYDGFLSRTPDTSKYKSSTTLKYIQRKSKEYKLLNISLTLRITFTTDWSNWSLEKLSFWLEKCSSLGRSMKSQKRISQMSARWKKQFFKIYFTFLLLFFLVTVVIVFKWISWASRKLLSSSLSVKFKDQ